MRKVVSIRSRHFQAGEHAHAQAAWRDYATVSIRSRHFQAGEPLYSAVKAVFGDVSIRSRHFQAGEQDRAYRAIAEYLFQSAPAIFRRENGDRPGLLFRGTGFNPLPPFSGGRTF